ncbi:MAG: asparagine synthase (glutamine-hydrolyzing) [Myxococcaceae bacterium]|nr:asparagine synthase (glutamine-hydrolyzing) [Myxococcaceae bacterium]
MSGPKERFMCGITGLWSSGQGPHPSELVVRLTDALRHRGPDASGHLAPAGGVAFGHRRLSIIDLSPAGAQPMVSASGRFTIVFNGEVYNFAALREQLEREGRAPAWRGHSDTEVMLAAIEAWGLERALTRFIGMFAFGLWDASEQHLHLVRDRLGVKPLYWTRTPGALAFASELKALQALPDLDTTLDRTALASFLAANCVPGTRSIFRGTHKVAPGTFLTFSEWNTEPRLTRYWDAAEVARRGQATRFAGSDAQAIEALEALLRDAVKLRMVSDVPLGAFLSGGVDSSTVVALMQAQSSRPVHTFSIENEVAAYDEGSAARAVARHLNTHHTPFTVTAKDALDVIPLLARMFDEPFSDSSQIPTYLVSKLARRDVTVALSGDGGDELFGGYTRHLYAPRLAAASRFLPPRLRHRLSGAITSLSPDAWDAVFESGRPLLPVMRIAGIRMHKLAAALDADRPEGVYEVLASHWTKADRVLADEASWPAPRPRTFAGDTAEDLTHEMMLRDLTGYLPDDILTKVDRASMAVSLEAREPLLDHRLVEFAWTLPLSMRVRGATGKWILREVLARSVPRDVISGPKMGFGVPLGEWLRGPLRDWAEALLRPASLSEVGLDPGVVASRWAEHLNGRRAWEHHLWDVLMLQAWRQALNRQAL